VVADESEVKSRMTALIETVSNYGIRTEESETHSKVEMSAIIIYAPR
jgi:hypothetical protein